VIDTNRGQLRGTSGSNKSGTQASTTTTTVTRKTVGGTGSGTPPLVPIVELLLVTLVLLDALPVLLLISRVPLTPESPKFLPTVEVATLLVFRFTPSTTGLGCFPSVLRSVFTIELVILGFPVLGSTLVFLF
jgi:hypothetical protein